MKEFRIGLIGCGGISGTHLPQIEKAEGGVIHALCDIHPGRLKAAGDRYGVPEERRFTDWHDLIALETVDAVDICTPNNLHVPMAMASVDAGKPFCVEKPLGVNYAETAELLRRTEEKNIPAMICFSYRFMPAVRYARHLVEEGVLGNVINIYAQYLKSSAYMPGRRLDWRFDKDIARYGVSGDLGVHILDLTTFLAGDLTGLFAQIGTAVPFRKREDSEEIAPVTTDDWCHFLARFSGGASATFSITRAAYGNRNHIMVDIYGEKGALRFDLDNNQKLEFHRPGTDENSMEELTVPEEFRAGQQQCFINLLHGKKDPYLPTLADGVRMQKMLDAIMESAEKNAWIDIL
ncbi:MAG: Gfo/Idh/MocA family oxidoreductase [Clostridia bacterium]|nr:Gfo/Idh/MocA family oxidoreductase [Clostridia bacterium]